LTLLGVDIGTTHVKACAYGEDGKFLFSEIRMRHLVSTA
jgi:sugar (pentulose or hexulose) kinase